MQTSGDCLEEQRDHVFLLCAVELLTVEKVIVDTFGGVFVTIKGSPDLKKDRI